MKRLLLILAIAILFLSCSPESATEDTCDCYKETWVRYQQNDWYFNGSSYYYSDECDDNGDVVGGYSGQGYQVEYRINCN